MKIDFALYRLKKCFIFSENSFLEKSKKAQLQINTILDLNSVHNWSEIREIYKLVCGYKRTREQGVRGLLTQHILRQNTNITTMAQGSQGYNRDDLLIAEFKEAFNEFDKVRKGKGNFV